MPNFRGRAPSGLISRETGNYAWVGENGENLLAVDPTDKGLTHGAVDCNTYNSTALAPIPYTIGSNITTPVATFKVTRAVELPSGAYAVYGTHVSGIIS